METGKTDQTDYLTSLWWFIVLSFSSRSHYDSVKPVNGFTPYFIFSHTNEDDYIPYRNAYSNKSDEPFFNVMSNPTISSVHAHVIQRFSTLSYPLYLTN